MLKVVMYHYVRDPRTNRYPRLNSMRLDDFRSQVKELSERFEMATLESSLAYLKGSYRPARDLCLLTFDDGLAEHFNDVTPVLADCRVQGIFFLISACIEEQRVAPVHMNHILMAELDFDEYRREFLSLVSDTDAAAAEANNVDSATAAATYVWDTPEIAAFKYYFNFVLDSNTRDQSIERLFEKKIGAQSEFSRELYFDWEQARQMASAGMLLGGHSHGHRPMALLTAEELAEDVNACSRLLSEHLSPQAVRPFCYPYGKPGSFSEAVAAELQRVHFDCAFSTVAGVNEPGADHFALRRVDCKNALDGLAP